MELPSPSLANMPIMLQFLWSVPQTEAMFHFMKNTCLLEHHITNLPSLPQTDPGDKKQTNKPLKNMTALTKSSLDKGLISFIIES